jgi:hypothetical protein
VVGLRVGGKNAGDASTPFSLNLRFFFAHICHYTGSVRTNYIAYSFILSETSLSDTVLKAY